MLEVVKIPPVPAPERGGHCLFSGQSAPNPEVGLARPFPAPGGFSGPLTLACRLHRSHDRFRFITPLTLDEHPAVMKQSADVMRPPERPSGPSFDAIVVGAGLAGCFAALRLAERGLSVLVLEAGTIGQSAPLDKRRWGAHMWRRLSGRTGHDPGSSRWTEPLRRYAQRTDAGSSYQLMEPYLGCGPGGSSAIYAAALGRFRRSDFTGRWPGASREAAEAPLPMAWPIDYDAFGLYYAQAEALLRVAGENDPLDPDDTAMCRQPPACSERDRAVFHRLIANGLHPYRLKVGFDYLQGCTECAGRRCLRGCKADGYNRALARGVSTGRVRLETGMRVESLATAGNDLCVLVEQDDGTRSERRGSSVVLAAGALNTPLILARSERLWGTNPRPAMLGRGLMFHNSDLFAVRVSRRLSRAGPRKTLALRDYYAGVGGAGEIQSTGLDVTTGFLMSRLRERARWPRLRGLDRVVEFIRPLAWASAQLCGSSPIFATITHDLPFGSNRVWEDAHVAAPDERARRWGPIALHYAPRPELRARARHMRRQIRAAFAPFAVLFLTRPAAVNWGHPMGTCRMGSDPATSVINADGHLWSHASIYVADASAFPSSGGTGPALTVAANALRVADRLAARHRRTAEQHRGMTHF